MRSTLILLEFCHDANCGERRHKHNMWEEWMLCYPESPLTKKQLAAHWYHRLVNGGSNEPHCYRFRDQQAAVCSCNSKPQDAWQLDEHHKP